MFKKFFSQIFQAAPYPQFPYMQGAGVRGIPPQVGFGQVFNSLNGAQGFYSAVPYGQVPQAPFLGAQTVQAYKNVQSKSSRANLRNQALAPGSVLINSQPLSKPPQAAPFQGFAGQATPFGYGSGLSPYQSYGAGTLPFAPYATPFLGKAQLLLYPVFALFGLIKSILGLGRFVGVAKPLEVNKDDTGYNRYQDYVSESYIPGDFDEPSPYNDETLEDRINIESSGLEGYF